MISRTDATISDLQSIDGLYCVGDSCFPGQGVIAVAFSGVMCAHRVAADIGKHKIKFSPSLSRYYLNYKKRVSSMKKISCQEVDTSSSTANASHCGTM
jgi:hypothetical protein